MQLSRANHRFRGWRRSADLVELARMLPTDLKRTLAAAVVNEAALDGLNEQLTTLGETRVAALQHLRVQVQYRLQRDV